jgi:hypothetical protein
MVKQTIRNSRIRSKLPRQPFVARGKQFSLLSLQQDPRRHAGLVPRWVEFFALGHDG